jgi:hypothetical protein
MASLQKSLDKALKHMARGSQGDPHIVNAAVQALDTEMDTDASVAEAQQPAGLLPLVPRMLQVAGWLYPCFAPSSPLDDSLQTLARRACITCMNAAGQLLDVNPPSSMAGFLALLEPRSRPQVPGEHAQCRS